MEARNASTKDLAEIREYTNRDLKSVAAEATIQEAGQLMAEHDIGALLVVKKDQFVGIVTDTDLARKGIGMAFHSDIQPVQVLMTTPLVSIDSHRPVDEAYVLMKDKNIRHLTVTENGRVMGIVSTSDLLRYYATHPHTAE